MNQRRVKILRKALGPAISSKPNFWRYIKKLWTRTPRPERAKLLLNLKKLNEISIETDH